MAITAIVTEVEMTKVVGKGKGAIFQPLQLSVPYSKPYTKIVPFKPWFKPSSKTKYAFQTC